MKPQTQASFTHFHQKTTFVDHITSESGTEPLKTGPEGRLSETPSGPAASREARDVTASRGRRGQPVRLHCRCSGWSFLHPILDQLWDLILRCSAENPPQLLPAAFVASQRKNFCFQVKRFKSKASYRELYSSEGQRSPIPTGVSVCC